MTPNTENAMVLGITMNCLVLQHRDFFDINRYSDLRPLKRILAHVLHFIKRVKQRLDRKQLGIEVPKLIVPQKLSKRHYPKYELLDQEDYAEAHIRLVHLHQRRYFSEETKRIEDKGSLALSSKFAKLGPVLVPHRGLRLGPSQTPIQILRLGGRIHRADHLADSARLPFLLHPADHFTTLIVRHCHAVDLQHAGGIRCSQCELQRSCLVVGSVNALKKLLRDCVTCKKRHPKATITQMATIPSYRIPDKNNRSPVAFDRITLDAAGSWKTFHDNVKKYTKRWMLNFRDILYGVIFIDILYKMDSALFLNTFKRFCNDRRVPTHIRLDYGTNFVAGKKDLSDMWQYVSKSNVKSHRPNIKWDFTPPYSPLHNGLIERIVGSAKAALRTLLDVTNEVITDETLLTCFKKVQGLLNDRPLAYLSKDCNDLELLTPNHFILTRKIRRDLAPIINYRKKGLETQYKIVLSLVEIFWRRFVQEMKPKMALYNKWINKRPNLMKDDIIVILDERESKVGPASRYPLARVIDTIKGHDGLVRKVSLLKYPAKPGGAPTIRGINSV
jgi:hypothetical protein